MKFVDRQHIDPRKWNDCVSRGRFYVPYARFEYLDAISERNWGAVIEGAYVAVFPVAYRRKWGFIPYIYQPYFCQQLGVFGQSTHSVDAFINKLPFYFIRTHLNVNSHFGQPKGAQILPNFVKRAPHNIQLDCNKDALKNIRRLQQLDVYYLQTKDLRMVLKLYAATWGEKAGLTWPHDYRAFESACLSLQSQHLIYACTAYNGHELLGAALFLLGNKRLHYVCAAPTKEGRECGIMHGIVQHALMQFPDYDLDFEGSQIPSVAAFYKKFSPVNEAYYRIERTLHL